MTNSTVSRYFIHSCFCLFIGPPPTCLLSIPLQYSGLEIFSGLSWVSSGFVNHLRNINICVFWWLSANYSRFSPQFCRSLTNRCLSMMSLEWTKEPTPTPTSLRETHYPPSRTRFAFIAAVAVATSPLIAAIPVCLQTEARVHVSFYVSSVARSAHQRSPHPFIRI